MWKNRKMGDLSDFARCCAFSWSICDRHCHIIGRIESDSFWGYVDIHESWEDNISEEEQWVKINIDRKRLSYIEKDSFEKNHRTTVAQVR
jgi:hypothetical protein